MAFCACRLCQRRDAEVVGGDDLTGPWPASGKSELVARGEDGNARASPHGQLAVAHGGGERQLAGPKAPAGAEQNLPRAEVKTLWANMTGVGMGLAHAHQGPPAAHWLGDRVFLDDDCIGSGRQRSSGEDA